MNKHNAVEGPVYVEKNVSLKKQYTLHVFHIVQSESSDDGWKLLTFRNQGLALY